MIVSKPVTIYDQDFNLWIEQTVDLLKARRFDQLDIENLIDELESMSKRDRREIVSRLKVLLLHLLKWRYQPGQRSNSWRSSIWNNREEISQILKDSPSLRNYPSTVMAKAYASARQGAAIETGLALETFPDISPFTVDEILDPDFWSALVEPLSNTEQSQ